MGQQSERRHTRGRQQSAEAPVPLLYSSLTTRRSSYPAWLLIKSSPIQNVVRRMDLGNEAAQVLLSSNCALEVPPIINDIAATLPWLLRSAPFPLLSCYMPIVVNLQFVADCQGDYHIHPFEAHLKISIVCINRMLFNYFSDPVSVVSNQVIQDYVADRWGNQIQHVGFHNILLDLLEYVRLACATERQARIN
jgi:hypothetical protein